MITKLPTTPRIGLPTGGAGSIPVARSMLEHVAAGQTRTMRCGTGNPPCVASGGSEGTVTVAVSDPRIEAFEALRPQPPQACLVRLEGLLIMHPSERRLHLTFLHGQPGAGSDWSALIDRLPDSWDVLAGDRPGYGSNSAGPGDFSANARFVLRELDAAEVAETVLVGHSYGGGVALTVAAMAPERV